MDSQELSLSMIQTVAQAQIRLHLKTITKHHQVLVLVSQNFLVIRETKIGSFMMT